MKMIRLFSLLLSFFMLCGLCTLFASCSGEQIGVATVSKKTVEIDLTDYQVVYAAELLGTETLTDFAGALTERLGACTGLTMTCSADSKTTSTQADPEILIGLTDRTQSTKVQNDIKGDGFAICVVDNKIVITGTNYMHIVQAMQFFCEQYLGTVGQGTTLTLHETVKANKQEQVILAEADGAGAAFVYDAALNAETKSGSIYMGGGRDYPCVCAEELRTKVAKDVGIVKDKLKNQSFPMKPDSEEATGTEFLIGTVNRDACRAALAELSGDEYGFFVKEGCFVLTAYNETALALGHSKLLPLLSDATSDVNGKTVISFPEGFFIKACAEDSWVTDFTKPAGEGIELTSTMDTSNSSLQYYYTGSGVGPDSYRAYLNTLKGEGYTVLTENEIEQSLYTTLVSQDKRHSLYVAYNAYAHGEEVGHTYPVCIRVVSSPADAVTLPDAGLLTPDPRYTRVTSSSVTTLEILSTAAGMCYIVVLEDGRLVVFDSGGVNTEGAEHTDLWNLLCATHERISGAPTTTNNPIHIAAWVITHSHWDHYAALDKMLGTYGSTGKLRMDYMLGNFPSQSAVYRVAEGGILLFGKDSTISSLQSKIKGGFRFVKVHAGQKFYLANLEIEVLTTFDDLAPLRIDNQNDTNTVLRFTMNNTNKQGQRVGDPVTILWPGDANRQQSRYLCAMFGSYLKSDMVQMAHHGNIGCEKDFYSLVAAEVLWFPIFQKHFDLFLTPQWTNSYAVNIHTVNLPSTKYIYVSGNNDGVAGNYNICLPFSEQTGRPDYDGIYEGMTGEPRIYDNLTAFNSTDRFKQ